MTFKKKNDLLVGRREERRRLEQLLTSKRAEFLAVYGRRRVGKTYLIEEFFKDKGLFFEIVGTKDGSRTDQLRKFHREWNNLFGKDEELHPPKDWGEALYRLKDSIQDIPETQKIILFFDELPWLASRRSGFMMELDYIWNRHFSKMVNVLLVICGSAAAWMIKHVIRNKGGLYGRLSAQIRLNPFTLAESQQCLNVYNIQLDRKQLVELYMITGGVAKYLTMVPRGKSTSQIVDELCFSSQGALLTEFTDIYHSLFEDADRHLLIVRALAGEKSGLTRNEITERTGVPSGGRLSILLNELEESSFIASTPLFGQTKRDLRYRLIDEYSLFYLRWIEPRRSEILHGSVRDVWLKIQQSQGWKSWSGYAFENVCIRHVAQIKNALGLGAVSTVHSHWSVHQEVQIDLVIDRADGCINLCEIKFCSGKFRISTDYASRLHKKKQLFLEHTKSRKTLFTTLITPYGAVEDNAYLSVVDNQLTLDALFSERG